MANFTCPVCGGPARADGWCAGACDPGRPGGHPAEDLQAAREPVTGPPDTATPVPDSWADTANPDG